MTQTKLSTKPVAQIGEEIGLELGAQMIRTFNEQYPSDVRSYIIGRNILDQILAQPGCEGIEFYNAINEKGQKTLVYVGLDCNRKEIIKIAVVTESGELNSENGIVADRNTSRPAQSPRIGEDLEWWEND